mmetsp:Transcript_9769/g.18367  ORF Transcript_9769/g.18367 Transcript_9769/m.18367 type:complete len:337 (-) Transcript_9769:11-1021(-)
MNEANYNDGRCGDIYQRQRSNAPAMPGKTGDDSVQQPCLITPWSQEPVENSQDGNSAEEKGEDSDDAIEIIGVMKSNPSQIRHVQKPVQQNKLQDSSPQYQSSHHQYPETHHNHHGYHSSIRSGDCSNHERPYPQPPQGQMRIQFLTPYQIHLKNHEDHEPTWEHLWPKLHIANPAPLINTTNQIRAYKLSLLSSTEFTVTAVMHHTNRYDFVPSLTGLRKPIKEITRVHSREGEKAMLEEGKWRVPLSVYQIFYGYLCNQSNTDVEGIPASQLNIASFGRAAAERGYPSPEDLIDNGVPPGLAYSLAPYQRGGVDFVLQRGGKALIADEMGLGRR